MDLELEHVQVERDGRLVLDIPSLRIRGGRTTAILGPNGSGKTTLLRAIAGLERANGGTIRAGGDTVRAGRHLAYMFQEQVFLRQTVRANLELGLRLRGVRTEERRQRAEQAARLLGVEHLLERRADRLSGGEGRRVSIARALCLRAPFVLLDEPLEGLDQPTYSTLLSDLPALLAAFDATTLLVTHTRHEALRLAQDLVVVVAGRVLAAGDISDVVRRPSEARVAEVLGHAVLRAGGRLIGVPPGALKVGDGEPAFALMVEDVADLVERKEVGGRIDGVRVQLELRPEDVTPSRGTLLRVYAAQFWELPERS